MTQPLVAIYARVSSEQQAQAGTIESQLAALRERVASDAFVVPPELEFVDDGYSGSTLIRPALERLRDVAASGSIDRLFVHSPDRLARKYAYQVLLIDEFRRAGVEVIFLNRAVSETPEDELLLQVQGMVAEYERAKILERSRRGKRHAAKVGSVSVLGHAPYGYRYVSRPEGGGAARWDVVLEETRIVRQIFEWVGHEKATIAEVCRRLRRAGEKPRGGKTWWHPATVCGMLKNPAYMGSAAFGRTRVGARRLRLRPQRGQSEQPRYPVSRYSVDAEKWVRIPVPAIISGDLFSVVQEQLQENRKRARQGVRGGRHLLQGLAVCKRCGYAFYATTMKVVGSSGTLHQYTYYRCTGTDANRFGGERICSNKQIRADIIEPVVWNEVCRLIENPARLAAEYQRRLDAPQKPSHDEEQLKGRIASLRRGVARLVDSYAEGVIDKGEFEPRVARMKTALIELEKDLDRIQDDERTRSNLHLILGQMEEFANKVKDGVAAADWGTRRQLMGALIRQIEIDVGEVNVVFRVPPQPPRPTADAAVMPDSLDRGGPRTS